MGTLIISWVQCLLIIYRSRRVDKVLNPVTRVGCNSYSSVDRAPFRSLGATHDYCLPGH
jgi:hypothetical protein